MNRQKGMSMIATLLLVVAVGIAGLLAYAATRPDTFHYERSIRIAAAPDKIYPLIEDLHRWNTWSPYEKKDPAMKRSYEGPSGGVGAKYAWDGNSKVGAGTTEVIEATPDTTVKMRLVFVRPMEGTNIATFTLVPDGDGTRVTWNFDGPAPFVTKLVGVVLNMDKMVGNDFDEGLASLKALVEKA